MNTVAPAELDVAVLGSDPLACAIARDAVGRGLRVVLLCQDDIGGSFAQLLLHQGQFLAADQDPISEAEQKYLLRIAPHLSTADTATSAPKRTLTPASANRFALLCARDAAERGAVVHTRCGPIRYTELGTGWHISAGETASFYCKLVVDVRPNDPSDTNTFARVAVFHGHLPTAPKTLSPAQTLYALDPETVVAATTASTDITARELTDLAAANGIQNPPLWVSPQFIEPDLSNTFEIFQTPPLFRAKDAGDFNWRSTAETIVAEMAPFVRMIGKPWTQFAKLPGGDFQPSITQNLFQDTQNTYKHLGSQHILRLFCSYGTAVKRVLSSLTENSVHFGHGLFDAEVDWLIRNEWARSSSDILWRRTHLGLVFTPEQVQTLDTWMADRLK